MCADLFDDAAARLGVARRRVAVVRVEPPDWPDACLGCADEGDVCATVITPGYLVVVAVAGTELEYHTWKQGRTFRFCS